MSNPGFAYSEDLAVGGNKEEIDELNQKIADQKTKIKDLEEAMAKYKKNIESTKLQAASLKNQISILNNRFVYVPMDVVISKRKKLDPFGPEWVAVLEATGQPVSMKN